MTHPTWSRRRAAVAACVALPAALAAACAPPADPDRLRVSGHVEATEVRLAPEIGGRVTALDVKEGDRIEAGARILTLDATDVDLAIARARTEEASAEAQLRLVRAAARVEDVRQAEAQVEATRADVPAAKAELEAATADLQRFDLLLQRKSGSQKQRDDAATRRDVAAARLDAAEKRVAAAEAALARVQAGARREEVAVAESRIATAKAAIATLEDQRQDATLSSPVAGIVTEKLVEAGEMVAPRAPVVVITDLDHAWADVYVPEPAVPRIRMGQAATLFTDAGGAGIPGTVTYISPKAEFTPRNVQTADERAKLVYRIRITVDNTSGVLKQGMPVDAELALTPAAPVQP
ncbi:MAG: HlyD family efflux transporter periplasmic adaptor subunit [Vicinamibacterales bacterium]